MGAYKQAGVDIDAKMRALDLMREAVAATHGPAALAGIGHFGGFFSLAEADAPAYQQASSYRAPVLVSSADSVGTKIKLAILLDRHDTVGQDIVNHCVNDILVCGAFPLFFLDYIAVGRLNSEQVATVVGGLAKACRAAGCALVGGETAELPGLYRVGDYDLAGFIVGMAEKVRIISGASVAEGDIALGLPSNGLHTNGYSLARRALGLDGDEAQARAILNQHDGELGGTLADALLAVHRSYLPDLRPILEAAASDAHAPQIKALAHITGGGLVDNVPRVLPPDVTMQFMRAAWEVPPIFALIQERGKVNIEEMYRVFNMGIGMVIIATRQDTERLMDALPEAGVIGRVVKRASANAPQVEIV
jgi:phosphoribosylformylglycinamidine cyclo-ligase